MAILPIRLFGDPVLRERAREVTDFDDALARLAEDMLATMRRAQGAGLAANQVGVLRRLFTWEHGGDEHTEPGAGAWVNPEVLETSEDLQEAEEGCLSFPGLFYPTERPLRARMRGFDVRGDEHTIETVGLMTRIILHEIDHLNGILFVDHLARHDKKEAMRRIRAGELEVNAEQREAEALAAEAEAAAEGADGTGAVAPDPARTETRSGAPAPDAKG